MVFGVESLASQVSEWHMLPVESPPRANPASLTNNTNPAYTINRVDTAHLVNTASLTRYLSESVSYLPPCTELSVNRLPAFRQTTTWMTAQSPSRHFPIHQSPRCYAVTGLNTDTGSNTIATTADSATLRRVSFEGPEPTPKIHSAARIPSVVQVTAVEPPTDVTFPCDAEQLDKVREIAALHLNPSEMTLLDRALKTASFPESVSNTRSERGVVHATYANSSRSELSDNRTHGNIVDSRVANASVSASTVSPIYSVSPVLSAFPVSSEVPTEHVTVSRIPTTEPSISAEPSTTGDSRFTPEMTTYWNAMLTASGVSDASSLAKLRQRLRNLDEMIPTFSTKPSPYDADLLLAYLYRKCFYRGYRVSASELNAPLERGEFNCVSATLLYYGLAKQRGWTVQTLVSTGHMRCQVQTTQGNYIVETTAYPARFQNRHAVSVRGTDGDNAQKILSQTQNQNPLPSLSDERAVDSLTILAGVLFYNRAIQTIETGKLDQSLSYAAASVCLDPDSVAAKSNFLASLNNCAIQFAENGDTEQARRWLRTAQELSPDHPVLIENYQRLLQQCQNISNQSPNHDVE